MSNPSITFAVKENDQGQPYLAAELDSEGVGADDIRLRFARLAMRYAKQVADTGAFPISPDRPGDRVSVTLTFTQSPVYGDGHDFMEFDEDEDEFVEYPSDDEPEDPNAIGLRMDVSGVNGASRPFGWAASPAVMAAQRVAQMSRTAIEQSAGISHDTAKGGVLEGPDL